MKFGRKCKLSIEVNPDSSGNGQDNIVIPSDITVEFEIDRQSLSSSQTATFRLTNLEEKTRNLIFKDPWAVSQFRAIQFRAGYGGSLPICFNGFVSTAFSYRDGSNMITEINCYDGGLAMATGFTAQTVSSGTTLKGLLTSLAKSLPNLAGSPIVGNFPSTNSRGKVLFGNTWNVLIEESGGLATIDNNQVKILNSDECVQAEVPLIDSATGLLGSPRRTQTGLEFELLFEPGLTLGQIVQLQSTTNELFNGAYKVMGFSHRGIISPVESGRCTTSVSLWLGENGLTVVAGAVIQ